MTLKPDPNTKIKINRPSTSKNSTNGATSGNFFSSKDANKPPENKYYTSNKRI